MNDEWIEIIDKKTREEFQKVIKYLCAFAEKTGQDKLYPNPANHELRKLAAVDPDARFILQYMGGYVYHARAFIKFTEEYFTSYMDALHIKDNASWVLVEWVHEDGIRKGRDQFQELKNHPVHSLPCLTDFIKHPSSQTVDAEAMGLLLDRSAAIRKSA